MKKSKNFSLHESAAFNVLRKSMDGLEGEGTLRFIIARPSVGLEVGHVISSTGRSACAMMRKHSRVACIVGAG
jgi:hypothetical protein